MFVGANLYYPPRRSMACPKPIWTIRTMTKDIDFGADAFQTDLERAVKTDEGIENLDKAEAIYYLHAKLTGDLPDGHPSDHNGNATRSDVKAWAEAVAESERAETEGDD